MGVKRANAELMGSDKGEEEGGEQVSMLAGGAERCQQDESQH